MAAKAQGSQILEVAFTTTFYYWQGMVRIPQSLAREPFKPPLREKP
jgi:hypothetical protein